MLQDARKKRSTSLVKSEAPDEDGPVEEKMVKRMQKNRASAERSRQRKQAYLEEVRQRVVTSDVAARCRPLESRIPRMHGHVLVASRPHRAGCSHSRVRESCMPVMVHLVKRHVHLVCRSSSSCLLPLARISLFVSESMSSKESCSDSNSFSANCPVPA